MTLSVGGRVGVAGAAVVGVAFGMADGVSPVLIGATMLLLLGLLIYLGARGRAGIAIWLPAGLLIGGALGNLTDRLLREPGSGMGHVVDFIAVPRFAIFNIADCGVVVGVCLVVLLTLLGRELDGTRTGAGAPDAQRVEASPEEEGTHG